MMPAHSGLPASPGSCLAGSMGVGCPHMPPGSVLGTDAIDDALAKFVPVMGPNRRPGF